ncbi:hypothetical protein GYMLUDRAFT_64645 [Collybiopsis luxurians FD-317 M1]|uniref:Unplaced genomic scaffold GYMLUscaffold_108, whole genome shotgun sequence n=1 Tax=Collybiopsis luxurians FD-317 M1 TaxID=944289 RepID=A0A0D0BBI8_9AGAR|nr:hypothetical protein GYMLUDRAFT_64645 [Collybiopsis luxurians FD-317 M1]
MSTTIEPGKIFNVPEPTGTDVARAETTAAQAQIDAPTNSTARMTERNAETMQGAAEEAALMARSLGKETTGEPPSAGEQLRSKSETAIAHGKADIVKAMDEMQEYLGQAKRLPGNALEAVEPQIEKVSSYVGGVEGQTDTSKYKVHDLQNID